MRNRLELGLAALLISSAMAGCTGCETGTTRKSAPNIQVDPNPIVITDANVGATRERIIKVTNEGSLPLILSKDPTIVNQQGTNIEFGLANKLNKDCSGNPRPDGADLKVLGPSECAQLSLNYRASADGAFSAVLRFETNQVELENGYFDVPINGGALTPGVKACLYDGETEIACSTDGEEFVVNVTNSPVGIGQKVNRTLKLIADGTGEVMLNRYVAEGDLDFIVTPNSADFQPTAVASGHSFDFNVEFAPTAGGPREMTLTFNTSDPANQELVVRLNAQGDGPALCFCVGNEGASLCKPMATADFGTVATGQTSRKFVRLASCGTQPLKFKSVTVTNTDATPVFTGTDLPAANATLDPTAPPVEVKLAFSPAAVKSYTGMNGGGRLVIQTENQQAFINLIGNGIEGGCKLQAATMTLDFGQGAKGMKSQRILALSNTGGEDCTFPTPPTITVGAAVAFGIESFPTAPLPAGQTARLNLSYTPADTMGPDTGEITIPYSNSNGSVSSSLKIALRGTPVAVATCKLEALPAPGVFITGSRVLNFGQVRVNSTKVLPITLRNVGSAACNISLGNGGKIAYGLFADANTKSGFKIVTPPAATLAPGDTTTVEVSFNPTTNAQYGSPVSGFDFGFGASVVVNTSDTATFSGQECASAVFGGASTPGCVAWSLSGAGARSDLQILPGDVDFGLITIGCQSQEMKVTIYNTGTAPVTINQIYIDPTSAPFTVVGAAAGTLNGGAQRVLTVRYRPPDATLHTATLYVDSNATNGGLMSVNLRGRGTTESRQTDTFTQNATPKTDLLFVIDNSGSMSEEQGLLASNAQTFVSAANQLNSDYQIAVVTTDVVNAAQNGNFQGSPKIIRPSASAASQFANTVRALGTNGDATEQGLEAMFRALSDPLINDPMKNGGFLRQDAKLSVIIVSDEEDSSPASLNFYTDFLRNLKGFQNQSMVSLSAIVGDSPRGCSSSNGAADAGEKYINVQTATGGKFRSICSSNWGQIAVDLGLDIFAARAGYQLSRWAIPTSITVKVNGTSSPAADWTYDPATNTVVFKPNAIPAAGATVVIDYDTICY